MKNPGAKSYIKLLTHPSYKLGSASNQGTPVPLSYKISEANKSDKREYLVILHGLFGCKCDWSTIGKILSNRINIPTTVITVDLRNHGESPKSNDFTYDDIILDVEELLKKLKIQRTSFMGHSLGAIAAMYFSIKHFNMVEKLITIDTLPFVPIPTYGIAPDTNMDLTVSKDLAPEAAQNKIKKILSQKLSDEKEVNFITAHFEKDENGEYKWRLNVPVILQNLNNIVNFPEGVTGTFEGPVLFLGGKKSKYIPKEDKEDIKDWFPKAEIKYIDGGHFLHMEKPREFLEATLKFLNKQHELSFF